MKLSSSPRAVLAAAATPRRRSAGAFSLVITLIIVAMLAVVAIGFLSSMSSERATADAFGNKTRAEQAAQAGADSAMAILREAFKDFPDSATVWETQSTNSDWVSGGRVARTNEGTTLYLRALPGGNGLPDPTVDNRPDHAPVAGQSSPAVVKDDGSDARTTFILPLVSGAKYTPLASSNTSINASNTLDATDAYVDLNVLRYKSDTQGWIGSPPPDTSNPGVINPSYPRTVRVPWVEIKQPDTASPATAPVVARYAFWVEDESFRTNVNHAKTGDPNVTAVDSRRADNNASFSAGPLPSPNTTPTPTPDLALNASNVDLYATLHTLSQPAVSNDSTANTYAQSLLDFRKLYPGSFFPESTSFLHTPTYAEDFSDKFRYLATTFSSGLNLSRHGTQRLSLNNLIYPRSGLNYSPQQKIDAIIKTIQFHAPNFGQRFYRVATNQGWTSQLYSPANLNALTVSGDNVNGSPLRDHKIIYLNKIAANILDYIDADSQPTMIDQTGAVVTGTFKGLIGFNSVNGASPIWAMGKENIPYMDEAATRFRLKGSDPNRYDLFVDYYIEFWNMTGRDILPGDLKGAKIRIADPVPMVGDIGTSQSLTNSTYLTSDQPGGVSPSHSREYPLDNGTQPSGDPHERDLDIDISAVTFKAGRATVITTDPDFADIIKDNDLKQTVVVCPILAGGKREYSGPVPIAKGTITTQKPAGTRCTYIRMPIKPYVNTNVSDYQTSVVFYNANGYFEALEGPLPVFDNNSAIALLLPASDSKRIFGGSLHGNSNTSNLTTMTGDPRSNDEQLNCYPYQASGEPPDRTRYYNFTFGTNSANNSDSSFGMPNINFLRPNTYDTSTFLPWADYVALNTAKTGINAFAVVANAPLTSIGQLGDVYDPMRFVSPGSYGSTTGDALKAARGGGRTLKIGQHDDLWDGDVSSASRSWAAWRLADFFCTDDAMLQPGLININGVARDNGTALRAALSGFRFQNNAPQPAGSGKSPGRGATALEDANSLNVNVGANAGLQVVIDQIKKRLVQPTGQNGDTSKYGIPGTSPYNSGRGPFFERGELSELPAFGRTLQPGGTAYAATNLTGPGSNGSPIDMNSVEDRGREEVFRRLAEMITTRGNVFTVYAMGQSIQTDPGTGKKRATGTQRLKVTFRLTPKQSVSTGSKSFHPATDAEGNPVQLNLLNRFIQPDHYDIEILASSKGGG